MINFDDPATISGHKTFSEMFSHVEKNNIFSELEKNLGYSFCVKNCDLSIYEVFEHENCSKTSDPKKSSIFSGLSLYFLPT